MHVYVYFNWLETGYYFKRETCFSFSCNVPSERRWNLFFFPVMCPVCSYTTVSSEAMICCEAVQNVKSVMHTMKYSCVSAASITIGVHIYIYM